MVTGRKSIACAARKPKYTGFLQKITLTLRVMYDQNITTIRYMKTCISLLRYRSNAHWQMFISYVPLHIYFLCHIVCRFSSDHMLTLTLYVTVSLQKLQHTRSHLHYHIHSSPQHTEVQSITILATSSMPQSHTTHTNTNEFSLGLTASQNGLTYMI